MVLAKRHLFYVTTESIKPINLLTFSHQTHDNNKYSKIVIYYSTLTTLNSYMQMRLQWYITKYTAFVTPKSQQNVYFSIHSTRDNNQTLSYIS